METYSTFQVFVIHCCVLILPMRNGNLILYKLVSSCLLVLILPMRNGNIFLHATIVFLTFVLILPMRNGNCIFFPYQRTGKYSSYPTYEEWKHNSFISLIFPSKCSYPTYEEWKLINLRNLSFIKTCSYPTYEEWKPLS